MSYLIENKKPATAKQYLCLRCTYTFTSETEPKPCPVCRRSDELVCVYLEDEPEMDQMRSREDWNAGD